MDNTKVQEYLIPASAWMTAQAKIAKLNKKAARNGIPETTPRIVETLKKDRYVDTELGSTKIGTRTFYRVELESTEIKIEGWNFVAKIDHLEAGNMIYNTTSEDLSEQWRTADPACQHCNIKRDRKETYIVTSEEGETRQIGSTCVREYTGIDPAKIFKWIEYLAGVELALSEDYDENEDRPNSDRESRYIDTEYYLAFVTCAIRNFGWTPRSKADGLNEATADTALGLMFAVRDKTQTTRDYIPTRDDCKLAQAAVEHIKGVQTRSDYEWNLKLSVDNEVVPHKALGIVASLIPYYKRHLEHTVERAAQYDKDKASTHVGTVGKRQDFTLTLTKMLPLEGGQWGPTYLHKFRDQDGNVVSWFSSRMYFDIPSDNGNVSEALTEGETYTVKATVKKHDDYQGIPQTLITRAKIQWDKKVLDKVKS